MLDPIKKKLYTETGQIIFVLYNLTFIIFLFLFRKNILEFIKTSVFALLVVLIIFILTVDISFEFRFNRTHLYEKKRFRQLNNILAIFNIILTLFVISLGD